MKIKSAFITGIAFVLLLAACQPIANTPAPVSPTTPAPEVFTYEGISSFSGGAGNYVVQCEQCTASAVSTKTCQSKKDANGDGTQIYEDIRPAIVIIQNGYTFEGKGSTDEANGSWIITEQSIPYVREFENPENLECKAEAQFNVVFTVGGTVTKLP